MKLTNIAMAAVAAALLLTGCTDDPIYDTSHPATGKIFFTIDWSGRTEGVAIPATVTATAGQYSAQIPAQAGGEFPNLLVPGTYHLNLYNAADKVAVSGTTASVATINTPQGFTGTFVDAQPGWLFTWATDQPIEKDHDYDITAVMQQQVRQLSITLTVKEGDPARISGIAAELTGVTGAIDINTGQSVGPAVGIIPLFALAGDKLTATVRLLGITGSEQKLIVRLTFSDGTVTTQTIESDLSTQLAGFNADKKTPMALGSDILTPIGAGFTATITDWTKTTGSFELK